MKFPYPNKRDFHFEIAPLIDVVFLIIVFLILSLGKVQSYLKIELPKLDRSYVELKEKISRISIQHKNNQNEIFWNQTKIELKDIEKKIHKENPKRIIIEADKNVPYGMVIQIFAEIQKYQKIELLLEYEIQNP